MVERLDRLSPGTAPHGFYVAFRYVKPRSEDALRAMAADGVERAVAFTQYPQFSCSTTGSSLNELWRAAGRTGLEDAFEWSIIDRWPVHDGFIAAMADTVREGLEQFDPADRDQVLLLFSAHSLPLDVIDRGDPYPAGDRRQRPGGGRAARRCRTLICSPTSRRSDRCAGWARAPSRSSGGWAARGQKHVLVVPIAFTSDHIETLSELDREYGEVAHQAGITQYRRDAGAQRSAPVHRRVGGYRARAPRVGRALRPAVSHPLPGMREPAMPADPESGRCGGGAGAGRVTPASSLAYDLGVDSASAPPAPRAADRLTG